MYDTSPDSHFDPVAAEKQMAMSYLAEAFAEAELDGVDQDAVVQAALFWAFRHLVDLYGEEPAAEYAARLPDRIRGGAFSVQPRH